MAAGYSGTADHPVTWAACPGEQPVISGGRRITWWRTASSRIEGLPEAAREHVWFADLPPRDDEPWCFCALFDGSGLLTQADSTDRASVNGGIITGNRKRVENNIVVDSHGTRPWYAYIAARHRSPVRAR